jgi:hypothetical protein
MPNFSGHSETAYQRYSTWSITPFGDVVSRFGTSKIRLQYSYLLPNCKLGHILDTYDKLNKQGHMAKVQKQSFNIRDFSVLIAVVGTVGLVAAAVSYNGAGAGFLNPTAYRSGDIAFNGNSVHADSVQFGTHSLVSRGKNDGLRFIATTGGNSNASVDASSERGELSMYLTPAFLKQKANSPERSSQGTLTYMATDGTYFVVPQLAMKDVKFTFFNSNGNTIDVNTDNAYLNSQPAHLSLSITYDPFVFTPNPTNETPPQLLKVSKVKILVRYLRSKSGDAPYASVVFDPAPQGQSVKGNFFMPQDTMLTLSKSSLPGFLIPNPTSSPASSSGPMPVKK